MEFQVSYCFACNLAGRLDERGQSHIQEPHLRARCNVLPHTRHPANTLPFLIRTSFFLFLSFPDETALDVSHLPIRMRIVTIPNDNLCFHFSLVVFCVDTSPGVPWYYVAFIFRLRIRRSWSPCFFLYLRESRQTMLCRLALGSSAPTRARSLHTPRHWATVESLDER